MDAPAIYRVLAYTYRPVSIAGLGVPVKFERIFGITTPFRKMSKSFWRVHLICDWIYYKLCTSRYVRYHTRRGAMAAPREIAREIQHWKGHRESAAYSYNAPRCPTRPHTARGAGAGHILSTLPLKPIGRYFGACRKPYIFIA